MSLKHVRPARFLVFVLLGFTTFALGFGCSDYPPVCYPDDYRACTCIDGRRGYQHCQSDGTAFGVCDCSLGYPPVNGTSGGTTSSSSGGYQTGT